MGGLCKFPLSFFFVVNWVTDSSGHWPLAPRVLGDDDRLTLMVPHLPLLCIRLGRELATKTRLPCIAAAAVVSNGEGAVIVSWLHYLLIPVLQDDRGPWTESQRGSLGLRRSSRGAGMNPNSDNFDDDDGHWLSLAPHYSLTVLSLGYYHHSEQHWTFGETQDEGNC